MRPISFCRAMWKSRRLAYLTLGAHSVAAILVANELAFGSGQLLLLLSGVLVTLMLGFFTAVGVVLHNLDTSSAPSAHSPQAAADPLLTFAAEDSLPQENRTVLKHPPLWKGAGAR